LANNRRLRTIARSSALGRLSWSMSLWGQRAQQRKVVASLNANTPRQGNKGLSRGGFRCLGAGFQGGHSGVVWFLWQRLQRTVAAPTAYRCRRQIPRARDGREIYRLRKRIVISSADAVEEWRVTLSVATVQISLVTAEAAMRSRRPRPAARWKHLCLCAQAITSLIANC